MFAAVISQDYLLPPIWADYVCCQQAVGGSCNRGQMQDSSNQTDLRVGNPREINAGDIKRDNKHREGITEFCS